MTADQDNSVLGFYKAKLVVMNIGDTYTTGLTKTAFVVSGMIKPASVIPSRANEPAALGGKVRAGTRTAAFKNEMKNTHARPL